MHFAMLVNSIVFATSALLTAAAPKHKTNCQAIQCVSMRTQVYNKGDSDRKNADYHLSQSDLSNLRPFGSRGGVGGNDAKNTSAVMGEQYWSDVTFYRTHPEELNWVQRFKFGPWDIAEQDVDWGDDGLKVRLSAKDCTPRLGDNKDGYVKC